MRTGGGTDESVEGEFAVAEMTVEQYEEVLLAGGVLPPGTEGAGERAVPLTARAYRHAGLDGRVVVRLVAQELGAAEDLAAGFLGLEPDGEPAVVGLGMRQALGFPEWVLVHHPEDGHHALGVVPELEKIVRQAKSKPKAALDAYVELAGRLAAAVPHFLPTYYEEAGRTFLGVENVQYAAQMFTRARRAEAEHGLVVDEERLDGVFLEFALAGALPVKTLSAYAKELLARVPADEALERFTRLCLRRTAGGLPPSAQMANDLRKLARAAGGDAGAVERGYLAELLELPATVRAAAGWWKAHRAALAELARERPQVRGALLDLVPGADDAELPEVWLELLEECGALAGLYEDAVPEEARPRDGAAGWFRRFAALRERVSNWRSAMRLPALYPLAERAAPRLRAELAASGEGLPPGNDVDLLDLLLHLGVPVADPAQNQTLLLDRWADGEGQRDLVALEADPRFRTAFRHGADRLSGDTGGLRAVRTLAASPGGRPMLAEWVHGVVRRSSAAGLPDFPDALRRLEWLPAEALLLAEDEVRAAAAASVAPVLARTLRSGLLDELGWPAWEEAATALTPGNGVPYLIVADAWPYLIVAGSAQARVIGADGTVLTHDLRIPAGQSWGDPGYHFVDGELLVYWHERGGSMQGYWHPRADRVLALQTPGNGTRGTEMNWYRESNLETSLPLPGGGRATGAGVVHRGDTAVPGERRLVGDGTSFWVYGREKDEDETAWHEFDPVSGRIGRRSMPGFFADALRDAPEGSTFVEGRLLPLGGGGAGEGGGLTGWRVVRLPDGTMRGEDTDGRRVTLPPHSGVPEAALLFPGDDRPRAVVRESWQIKLVDPDGTVTAVAKTDNVPGTFAEGSTILPPVRYWHHLRPRDPQGSAALRRVDADAAAALLKAAAADDEALPEAVRALLPQIGDERLLKGVVGVVRYAARQQAVLDASAERLTKSLGDGLQDDVPSGPADQLLAKAAGGVHRTSGGYWWHSRDDRSIMLQLRMFARAGAGAGAGDGGDGEGAAGLDAQPLDRRGLRLHLDGPALPSGPLDAHDLIECSPALAFRAAAAVTSDEHREALVALLREFDALGLVPSGGSSRWRRLTLHLAARHGLTPDRQWRDGSWQGLLALGGGAFIAVVDTVRRDDKDGTVFTALFHDPAERFEVPEPYEVRASFPLGEYREADGSGGGDGSAGSGSVNGDAQGGGGRAAGWLGALLGELAERGPAPWLPEAAEEFSRLTGVTGTMAKLVVSGMPGVDTHLRNFLPAEARALIGVKATEAGVAKDELRALRDGVRPAVLAALLPADPAALWTDGPDVAAAAAVWNEKVGRRVTIPEALLAEAQRGLRGFSSNAGQTLAMLLEPASSPELANDLSWRISGDRARPADQKAAGFTVRTLTGAVAASAWLAHRLPAGDPMRAALPAALAAVRDRLANPELLLDLGQYTNLPDFRKVAGAPTETGEGYERYGALLMATHDDLPAPAIRVALLDEAGTDPYLPVVRPGDQPYPAETALRIARDPLFAELLADPGEPAAGARGEDGTWWPQDPSRSAPDVVAEAAASAGKRAIGEDAAALYLMLLAMPDPTDRNTARWTGWKPARMKAARAELAASGLVVEANRTRAGRSLFLPGGWADTGTPRPPLEQWKLPLYATAAGTSAPLGVLVPTEPAAVLYRRAWQRLRDGDTPRFEELKVRRGGRGRRTGR